MGRNRDLGEVDSDMEGTLRRKGMKRGVRIFLGLTIVAVLGVLIISAGEYTWRDLFEFNAWKGLTERETWANILKSISAAFRQMRLLYLSLALLCISVHLYLHCLRLQLLSWATGRFISLRASTEFTFGGYYLGAITPFQSGGIPLQVWVLKREGLSVGEAGAVIMFRGVLSVLVLVVALPLLLTYRGLLGRGEISALIKYLAVLYPILLFILLSALFRTEGLKRHTFAIVDFFKKKRIVRSMRLRHGLTKLFSEVDQFKGALKDYFGKRKGRVALSFLVTLFCMGFYFLIAPILLLGMGITGVPFTQAIFLGMMVAYLLPFAPTPGASGIAEVVSSALFLSVCPRDLLGVYVLLWRFLTFYIGVTLGGLIILRMLRRGVTPPQLSSSKPYPSRSSRQQPKPRRQDC